MGTRKHHLPPEFCSPLVPCNLPVHRCPVAREDASHRILIMRTGAFGDILMGTPLLAALREAYPNAHLTWLAVHSEVQAIDANPYIDEFIRWDGSYWKKMLRSGLYPFWLARALSFRKALRAKNYNIFVSFQPEEWPLLVEAIQPKVSIGIFDTFRQFNKDKSTSRNVAAYTHSFTEADLPLHRSDQYLLPLRVLRIPDPANKRMQMGFTTEDARMVKDFLQAQGVSESQTLVILAPMTTWQSRCWPAERYAQLGSQLTIHYGCAIAVIGSAHPKEQEAIAKIIARMPGKTLNAAGVLTFRQMSALVARASVLVSGDTGPMHVAAAVGTPAVSLFGPTPVDGRAPLVRYGRILFHTVPCGPCDQKICPNRGADHMLCMNLITVEEVVAAISKVVNRPSSAV